MAEDTFEQKIISLVATAVKRMGSARAFAKATGVSEPNLSRWLRGQQSPRLSELTKIMDFLNVKIDSKDLEGEIDRDVEFVSAKVVEAGDNLKPPVSSDYLAAPMVGEVGAGPGYIPEERVKSWFLVYRQLPAVRFRRNLLAVEIGSTSTSMQPTLNPGDIVLVDRDDRDVQYPGRMMLVKDPCDNGMIKRVALQDKSDGDVIITYYSDNVSQYPPMIFSLKKDFYGSWDRCIIGRVIWAWTDVREK